MPHGLHGYSGFAFALDGDYDLRLTTDENGVIDFATVEDRDEVEQAVKLRISTRKGEDPFDADVGVRFWAIIGIFNPDFIDAELRRAVLSEPRVEAVTNIIVTLPEANRAQRIAEVSVSVKVKGGEELTVEGLYGG